MIARRIAQGIQSESRDYTLSQHTPELAALFGGTPVHSGETVSVDGALGLIPVFAAVQVISSSISVMPVHVYRRLTPRGRERATDTWQYRLLHEAPNDEMAPGVFFETAVAHMLLWGNAYLEKVKGSFAGAPRVVEMYPITPSRVNVERFDRTRPPKIGLRPNVPDGAKVFDVDGKRTFTEDTILHIPALGYDGTVGLSPIAKARQEIGGALARQRFQGGLYKRGANISGVLERPATAPKWSDEAAGRFKAAWRSWFEGGGSQEGGTPILQDGMTYKPIGMPLKDQQFIEQGQFTRTEIATLFNLPASKINGSTGDSLTYGNREQDALEYVTFSLLPWMTRTTQGLWRDNDLFPSRTFYPAFLPEALLKGDAKSRAEFYDLMMNKLRVLTPNDVADREDLPLRPDGDEFPSTPTQTTPAEPGGDAGDAT